VLVLACRSAAAATSGQGVPRTRGRCRAPCMRMAEAFSSPPHALKIRVLLSHFPACSSITLIRDASLRPLTRESPWALKARRRRDGTERPLGPRASSLQAHGGAPIHLSLEPNERGAQSGPCDSCDIRACTEPSDGTWNECTAGGGRRRREPVRWACRVPLPLRRRAEGSGPLLPATAAGCNCIRCRAPISHAAALQMRACAAGACEPQRTLLLSKRQARRVVRATGASAACPSPSHTSAAALLPGHSVFLTTIVDHARNLQYARHSLSSLRVICSLVVAARIAGQTRARAATRTPHARVRAAAAAACSCSTRV
jgi:hypothetical protein